MGEVADIIKSVHDIFDNRDVPIEVDSRGLGMAYAVPAGLESTVVDTYAPWYQAEVRQNFYRETLLGFRLVDLNLILSWRYSEAQQYIVDVYLDKTIEKDPTVGLTIKVRFETPQLYDTVLEAYEIPFVVMIHSSTIDGSADNRYSGTIRADGSGTFHPH